MESGRIWAAIAVLALFGVLYSWLVEYLHRHGYDDGFVWLEVVVGVGVTLAIGAAVVGIQAALYYLLFFAVSGTPLAIGNIIRHVRARKRERDE